MSGDDRTVDFVSSTDPYRRELLAHCYRMLGSLDEAEDLVQETYLRAWRAFERFEGRSSIRTWLYRIATNACLTALEHADRKMLPSGLMTPTDDPYAVPVPADPDVSRIQPIPSALVEAELEDPAAIVTTRESLRLALIASLQHLPARQRAVLILREVLAFPAIEVAQMLDISVPAVKSLLQRARATLEKAAPTADHVIEPSDPRARELLANYMEAFEKSDPAALQKILRDDVTLEAMKMGTWFKGLNTCLPFLATRVLGSPGRWRLLPTTANGQSAAATYVRSDDGTHHAYGLVVLSVTAMGISRITIFNDDVSFIARSGLPLTLDGRPD
ncbi:RNA polymerase sigma-70 factor (ECF subfamily) [Nonomuraea thailandensis]|uniref:RNA polymerase sigma factor n=1 Tax=Nonomuraea thailandensis TaxID=1188745 RepID=A0A9X2JY46_9ACTN|nr:sigma-70 family RNA polymerase sigma factor [Nonomuraea thailandensis]MCP2353797.1 RNA polymerase sigma-70 factor (ECF subfamily) [Nonomuraea thailandensis]